MELFYNNKNNSAAWKQVSQLQALSYVPEWYGLAYREWPGKIHSPGSLAELMFHVSFKLLLYKLLKIINRKWIAIMDGISATSSTACIGNPLVFNTPLCFLSESAPWGVLPVPCLYLIVRWIDFVKLTELQLASVTVSVSGNKARNNFSVSQ